MVQETIAGRQVITQPAGHLDDNESLLDAVRRESLEETGLEFEPSALVGVYRWRNPKSGHTWLRFAFTGEIETGRDPSPRDSDIERALWMTEAKIRSEPARLRSPQVLASIDDYNAGKRISLDVLADLED